MRPVCWNIITQIAKKYARDTLITPDEGPRWTEASHFLIKSLELECHAHILRLFIYTYIYVDTHIGVYIYICIYTRAYS